MEKLPEVETAKALMTEALTWPVMKWLREKKRVRKAADQANDALDRVNRTIKENWGDGLRAAYQALRGRSTNAAALSQSIDEDAKLAVKKIKDADDKAHRARTDAEETFDEAERQLSTRLAREGCRKAILSWELHEKAIEASLKLTQNSAQGTATSERRNSKI